MSSHIYIYVHDVGRFFWANSDSQNCMGLDLAANAKLFARTFVGAFSWKIARWPLQKQISQELDAIQCRMLALFYPVFRIPERLWTISAAVASIRVAMLHRMSACGV